jgi:hypothetical protein
VARVDFVEACRSAFQRLVRRYGFEEPEFERLGRETFARYHRAHRTISISVEPGSPPLVELFYPAAETGERPVPWAARQGVARCLRIPTLEVATVYDESDARSLMNYLVASAEELERVEAAFLKAK